MKLVQKLFLTLGLFVACSTLAEAHAFVDHADPSVGATVYASPHMVKIWFTRKIDPAQSIIQVYAANGREVDQHDAKIDPTDPTLMTVSISKLTAGTYKVAWKAVCLDAHTTHGDFTFEVAGL